MQIPIPLVVHRVIRLTSGRIIRRIFPSDHGIRQRQYRPVTWLEMLVFHDTSIGHGALSIIYNGIALNENSGWDQINEGIEVLINQVFQDEN